MTKKNKCSKVYNDYGTTILFLVFTPLLKNKTLFQSKIKYVYAFLFLSLYKSLSTLKKKKIVTVL